MCYLNWSFVQPFLPENDFLHCYYFLGNLRCQRKGFLPYRCNLLGSLCGFFSRCRMDFSGCYVTHSAFVGMYRGWAPFFCTMVCMRIFFSLYRAVCFDNSICCEDMYECGRENFGGIFLLHFFLYLIMACVICV